MAASSTMLRSYHSVAIVATALVLFAAGCATAPTEYREPPPLTAAERNAHNLQVFERTWELVNEKYFDARFRGVDWRAQRAKYRPAAVAAADETELYQVLNNLCAELKESHLSAIPPRRAHEQRTEHRVGVGFRWQLHDTRRIVSDIVPQSPAALAGIQPGWIVVSRNGAPLQEKDTYLPRLGQAVTYGFIDELGHEHSVTLVPQLLDFDRLQIYGLPGGFIYLRFDRFNQKSLFWFSEQLKAHANTPGVVIDLRNNPGGNLLALNVALSEFFTDEIAAGRLITRGGRESENQSLSWLSARFSGRIVILTETSTASAAEIFCHVLQHHKRATIIGRRTAGAVIVSRTYPLPGGGRLQVPVTDYIGLDGQRLEGRGVTPDLERPALSLADLRRRHDPDLAAALRALQPPADGDGPPGVGKR